jgi:outer membrane protein TolC
VLNSVSNKNLTLKISEQEFNKSKAEYLQTNAIFLPTITASYTGISTTNPLMAFSSNKSNMFFSFTEEENIDNLFNLIEVFNSNIETNNPIKAIVLPIEKFI